MYNMYIKAIKATYLDADFEHYSAKVVEAFDQRHRSQVVDQRQDNHLDKVDNRQLKRLRQCPGLEMHLGSSKSQLYKLI